MNNNLFYFSRFILITTLFFCFFSVQGQPEVYPADGSTPWTAQNLVEQILIGEGLDGVTNVNYTGDLQSLGYFKDAQGAISIDRGLVMSSGLVTDAFGDNCPSGPCNSTGNIGLADTGTTGGSDPDLFIAGNTGGTSFPTNDASVLEFDFVPNADTLQFRYVFASEEYQNFTCASFSDVFGFFLSGPGISGGLGYTNDGENVALIPGTNIPVSINSLNSGVSSGGNNCVSLDYDEFFINNINLGLDVEYNGLTTVLTATAVVIPCETYHIKLAISDMTDSALDSGVFLEAGSFGTNSINVEPYTVSLEGYLAEGCANGSISFTIPEPAENDIPINYTIEGTAQNGVDYTFIPLDLFIPQGEDSIGFIIDAFEDGMIEGEETFLLIVEKDICFFDTVVWTIVENPLVEPVIADAVICDGGSTTLDANIPIFQPPPTTFTNTNSGIIAPNILYEYPIEVTNSPNEILGPGMLNSICINMTSSFIFDVQVYLSTPSGAILELTTQNGDTFSANGGYFNTCFTESASTAINYNPSGENFAPGSSIPFTGNWQPEAPWSDIYGSSVNGTWTLLVTDVVPSFAPTFQDWSITFNSSYFLTYEWDNAATLSCDDCATPDASPSTNTTYTVTITDSYGCSVTGDVNVDVVSQLPAPVLTCGASTATSVIVEWADVGASSYEVNVNGTGWVSVNAGDLFYEVTGLAVGETVTIEVVGLSDDCDDTPISTIDCTAQACTLTTSLDGTTDLTCFQASDGTVTLSATGNGTITYDLGGGNTNTTGMFSNLAAGDYTASITDDDCTLTELFTITEPLELTASSTFSDVTCNGAADGSITITTLGGTANYTYQWSGGIADTDETIDGLSGGDYTATVTDNNGCTVTVEQTISENTIIALTTANTQATCNGIADGTATVTATGGTGTYDYLWDAAANNQITATAITDVGTYVVTVTDTDGCSMTASVDVTAPPAMTTTTSATQASCSGTADGTATVVANGGAGGYTYEWEDGQTTDVATGFINGWHYVTVTDTNGCNAIDSAEVTIPNPINLVIDGNNVSCNGGNDGDANVVASGGAGSFTYAWSPGGAITDAITAITANTYTVIVTDFNGCTASASIDITEPDALTLTTASTMVACFGESTGTVTTTVGGGEGTYDYLWATGETTDMLSNVPAGTYIVTVTDGSGCTIEASQVVNENPLLALTTVTTNANCSDSADGTATVTATGGTGTYDYVWNNLNADITDTATDLDAGTYIVTVTDSDGCITTASVDITAPLAIATSTTSTAASCSDATDGTAEVVATDGAGGFNYEWDNTQNAAIATGLTGGWHYVTVTDMNGCTALDSAEIAVPSAVVLAISGNDISCNGGNDGDATVIASGGAGSYTYLWAPSLEITETITGLAAGSYTVVAADMNGCTASISIDITEPAALTLAMSSTIVSCFGQNTGTATATVAGGTGAYNYIWSNAGNTATITNLVAGTYTVTATDVNDCEIIDQVTVTEQPELTSSMTVGGATCNGGGNGSATVIANGGTPPYTYLWSDNQITDVAVDLMAQTYTVTVTDDLGCITINSIDVAEPPALSVSVTGTDISCFAGNDGTVSATGNGGDGNYTFVWSAGAGSDLTGLAADTYTVTITDGNGCTDQNTITLQEPTEIIVNDVITNVACNGDATGSIIITPSGGTGIYTFLWSDGSTGQNCVNVAAGSYTLTLDDSNGCSFTESYIITEPAALAITLNPTDVFCFMGSDGAVNATITGGITPYSYAWTGGFITQDLSNIPAGTYNLVVTDANGCTVTATTTVNQPAAGVSVTLSADETVCFGATTASATATATGGAVGYTYQWSNGTTGITANNLGGGIHTVTVTDGNGCTTSGQMNVNELANITAVTSASPPNCFDGTDGEAIVLNINGGVGTIASDYTVVWSTTPAQTGTTATGLTANEEYTVTITDAFGCTGTSSVIIPNRTEVGVSLTAYTPVTCSGEDNGSLTVAGSGGTAPYTYLWDNGQTTETAIDLELGTYFVTVTDINGCTTSNPYEVTNPSMLDVSISNEDTSCPGLADGTATAFPTGGTQPYLFEWSNGETTASIDSLAIGDYHVTITDGNGCMIAASMAITQPSWLIYTATKTDVTCNGDRDGSIIIEATGGTPPYEYSYDWGETFETSNANVAMYPGYYGVVVRDANGCLSSYESIVIEEPLLVTVNIDPDTTVVSYELEDSIQLSAIVNNAIGNISYEWSGLYGNGWTSCLDCADPWLSGYENNTFEVLVTDENGCSATDEIEVLVTREREVFVPSGFTPNGDGVNDALMVHGNSSTKVETFRVYDRWGELVFRADNYAINSTESELVWDGTFKGKTMNSGVYIWHVAVKYVDGRKDTFEGNSTLLR